MLRGVLGQPWKMLNHSC
ncbi:hypothetical protein LINPERHAP1_LOCUS9866 [Linum perenne]